MSKIISRITYAEAYKELFSESRYKIYYGGRGSAKSWHFAIALVLLASHKKLRILCTREYQSTISESVHKLLLDTIERLNLQKIYYVTNKKIRCKNGSEFIFHGLFHDSAKIKSLENIDICWIEEGQSVSKQSWEVLIPTIRAENSEIWLSFNPYLESDETYKRFVLTQQNNAVIKKVTFRDNPWFPKVLMDELENSKANDYEAYLNVWEGECIKYSNAQIFKNKFIIQDFESDEGQKKYYGVDWGFAQDPTVLIRCYISGNTLYIDYEAYAKNIDIDEAASLFDSIPFSRKNPIRADSSRPETIRYMQKQGFNIFAVKKWPGSIYDGITILKSFEKIIIHPRCNYMIDEANNYSYKVDKLSGEVLAIIEDKYNHCFDALRYALELHIRGMSSMKFKR